MHGQRITLVSNNQVHGFDEHNLLARFKISLSLHESMEPDMKSRIHCFLRPRPATEPTLRDQILHPNTKFCLSRHPALSALRDCEA